MTVPINTEEEAVPAENELIPLPQEQVAALGIIWRTKCCTKCCCFSHCKINNHHTVLWRKAKEFTNPFVMSTMVDIEDENTEDCSTIDDKQMAALSYGENMVGYCLTEMLMNVNSDLSGIF